MIGKTLYHAKIVDEKVKMSSAKIVKVGRQYYHLDRKFRGSKQELKQDVGVVVFLTEQKVMDYLMEELRDSIKCGEQYLAKTRRSLINALEAYPKFPIRAPQ